MTVCDMMTTKIKLNYLFINIPNSTVWRPITEPVQIYIPLPLKTQARAEQNNYYKLMSFKLKHRPQQQQ
jgi:hypothetical protein